MKQEKKKNPQSVVSSCGQSAKGIQHPGGNPALLYLSVTSPSGAKAQAALCFPTSSFSRKVALSSGLILEVCSRNFLRAESGSEEKQEHTVK